MHTRLTHLFIKTALMLMLVMAVVACNEAEEKQEVKEPEEELPQLLSEQHQLEPMGELDLKVPALPESDTQSVSEQLDHIFYTDQMDRLNGTFIKDTSRDSARLARVQLLYSKGLIESWEDKYKAAFVFIHSGGPFASINSENFLIASELFAEVSRQSSDPQIVEESKEMAQTAFNRYVNTKIFETMIHDPALGKNGFPLINVDIDQS